MEIEKQVSGQTIKVKLKLSNGMYTPDLKKKHKASFNLNVQAFFRRYILPVRPYFCINHILVIHVNKTILYFTCGTSEESIAEWQK
jgi:hypothetical protein